LRLFKNRQSAAASRQRKKEHLVSLNKQMMQLTEQNSNYVQQIQQLTNQNWENKVQIEKLEKEIIKLESENSNLKTKLDHLRNVNSLCLSDSDGRDADGSSSDGTPQCNTTTTNRNNHEMAHLMKDHSPNGSVLGDINDYITSSFMQDTAQEEMNDLDEPTMHFSLFTP
jgi:K+-sensing histidine kinase KdpD